ncbi:hypothetical protein [Burkholderia pseudomallei]|uniref:hypothetical protein n=1 Tax=Burkholderia pseudomallei TaxID=28450 RepID=UPI0013E97B4A|nr:hypothetical protein [Burkholderia pseudomallei]
MKAIRIFYGALWLIGIVYVGSIGYRVIAPVAKTVVVALHNATLDNRGLHD